MIRLTALAGALLIVGCTPLPCIFNDTPQCEAEWRPFMLNSMAVVGGGGPRYYSPPSQTCSFYGNVNHPNGWTCQ